MTTTGTRTHALPDGRELGWHEFGDPHGVPCLFSPGTPASGLLGSVYDDAARDAGVRWISVDKPGYGRSDHDPQRSLRRYATDIGHLLDHLDLPRVVAVGESGGGPHTLALAHDLPERLHGALVIAGLGPAHDPAAREGMKRDNRILVTLAQRAPWLLRLQMRMLARAVSRPDRAAAWTESMRRRAPEADQRAWPLFGPMVAPAAREALADGGRSAAQEFVMLTRHWGFDLADITCPVHLWHGADDANVPLAVARTVLDAIPNAEPRIVDGEGHSLGAVLRHDVMATVHDLTEHD